MHREYNLPESHYRIFVYKNYTHSYGLYVLKNDNIYCCRYYYEFYFEKYDHFFDNNQELLFLLEFDNLVELKRFNGEIAIDEYPAAALYYNHEKQIIDEDGEKIRKLSEIGQYEYKT